MDKLHSMIVYRWVLYGLGIGYEPAGEWASYVSCKPFLFTEYQVLTLGKGSIKIPLGMLS